MGNSYDLLIAKINEFTRKFYLNKLLRGSIYAAGSILVLYLFLFVFVYYSNPGTAVKTTLFFSFLFLAILAIGLWIIKPALAYFKIGKNLSLEQAAALIGSHFFNVKDKLLNTLQLKALADNSPQNRTLIMAGIDQKISALRPVPFANAINLANNYRNIKYVLIPLTIILIIGIIAPVILKEGTNNFIRYNEEILPKAPFNFVILNQNLRVTQGDDITVKLRLTGDKFPQEVYMEDGVNTYKLEKENISLFNYVFKNVQKSKALRFFGGGFKSAQVALVVQPRPTLLHIDAELVYPPYLHRKSEQLNNVGNLLVPEGTKITWKLKTENSTALSFILQNKPYPLVVNDNFSAFSSFIKTSTSYRIVPKNSFINNTDSLGYQISVITDQFPSIDVTESPDSLSIKALYFSGSIADDYGFSALTFKYFIKQDGKTIYQQRVPIPIQNKQTENPFFYFWDLNALQIKPGQVLSYYFEVADNDGVNGPKTSRSALKNYQLPTAQEVMNKIEQGSESLKQKMESTIKLAKGLEKESQKLGQELLDKKQLSFEDKKQIEHLLDQQKRLEDAVKEIKKQNEKNTFEKLEHQAVTDDLKEKQKQIDNLFNHVLDEKTKELLQKLQQLMELNNKDQARSELSKMQMDNKTLRNELGRILELYKQLEFEQLLQHQIDRLSEMANKQLELSKAKNLPLPDLKRKQDDLNSDFKDLQNELKGLAQKNEALEKPNSYKNPEKETQEIEQKQKESKELLGKNESQKAAAPQEEAAEKMQQLAKELKESQQEGEAEESKVNAKALRRLLENLLNTSFEQEKTMLSLRKMTINDPAYVQAVRQQNDIKDRMKTIADSLFSLSKRVPQIESTVSAEVDKINFNIEKSIVSLGDRRTPEANRFQQFTMTSLNNLALMLNEALSQLQKAPQSRGKKQSMQQLQKMQEQLNKNMQNAREKMQKEGNMGTVPKGQMSEEFAKMAQQQQMIREALQKINQEENKDGMGSLGNLNQTIKDMKQTEMDLVNKKIEQETMNRQKNLLTKLLEADNAQREQDQDAKRESKAAKEFPPSYLQMLDKFKKQSLGESEFIQKLPPNLNYYYKSKITEYFKLLNSPIK
ncbi:MAG: DUF4175 family protein [Bacteroidota bacterium]